MLCVILTAGFSKLEEELRGSAHDGVPKVLLPVQGRPMLDYWWDCIVSLRLITEVIIVTNALKYKHLERWAITKGLPVTRVVNNGVTTQAQLRGGTGDLALALRAASKLGVPTGEGVVCVPGDTIFHRDFDLQAVLAFFMSKVSHSLLLYYAPRSDEDCRQRGVVEIDPETKQVVTFTEKPVVAPEGALVAPAFYILSKQAAQSLPEFVKEEDARSLGKFVEWSIGHAPGSPTSRKAPEASRCKWRGMRLPGAFHLIGSQAGLDEYRKLEEQFRQQTGPEPLLQAVDCIEEVAHARVGLMGNPGDHMNGRCLAFTIKNFWASVQLRPSEKIVIEPHALYDPLSFASLSDAAEIGKRDGFYGGVRLMMATMKRFNEFCTGHGLVLPKRNFRVRYDTNIPRQVGLAGSSAIITAFVKTLLRYYDLSERDVPTHLVPNLVLSVEQQELRIHAGPMDRVAQVYEGLMYLDCTGCYEPDLGAAQAPKVGRYERLPASWLEGFPFFVALLREPSDSGAIHSNCRERWFRRDEDVVQGVAEIAGLADQARERLKQRDVEGLADLMDQNFNVRRRLYGDQTLGHMNIRMVETARANRAAAKFCGSGGAVLGLVRKGGSMEALREAFEAIDCVFVPIMPHPSKFEQPPPELLMSQSTECD